MFDMSGPLRNDPLIRDFAQRVAGGKADLKAMEITLNVLKINKYVLLTIQLQCCLMFLTIVAPGWSTLLDCQKFR